MSKDRFVLLDGLRGIAAICVVIFHGIDFGGRQLMPHAYLAVDFFFVLSGFVIAHAYEARLLSNLGFGRFVALRYIRLAPLIVLGSLIGLVYAVIHRSNGHDNPMSNAQLAGYLAAGVILLPRLAWPSAQARSLFPLNDPAWSLFFELAANFAFAAGVRFLKTQRLLLVMLLSAAVLAAAGLIHGSLNLGAKTDTFSLGFFRVAFSFFCGVLIYRIRAQPLLSRFKPGFWVLAPLLVGVSMVPVDAWWSGAFDVLCVLALFPAIVALGCHSDLGQKNVAARLCEWSGYISYPIYILHEPLMRLVSPLFIKALHLPGHLLVGTLCVVVILAAAAAAGKLFDEPVRDFLMSRLRRRPAATMPVASAD